MPGATKGTEPATELIVALDFARGAEADACVRALRGLPVIYKVGFELFVAAGPQWVRGLVAQGGRVFLDLKFHDIPNTVRKAARQAAELGVEMFTLHLAGGPKMIQAVREELAALPKPPIALGVTVLTSFDEDTWSSVNQALNGRPAHVRASVEGLAKHARGWGATGIVCSPHELAAVRGLDPSLYTVVPGIRPEGAAAGDQARVMTPEQARQLGASAVVVGRPITEHQDPRQAAQKVLDALA
jgi:orotidine-5'-phosphate decarboxylase